MLSADLGARQKKQLLSLAEKAIEQGQTQTESGIQIFPSDNGFVAYRPITGGGLIILSIHDGDSPDTDSWLAMPRTDVSDDGKRGTDVFIFGHKSHGEKAGGEDKKRIRQEITVFKSELKHATKPVRQPNMQQSPAT